MTPAANIVAVSRPWLFPRLQMSSLLFTLLLGVVAFLVIYPIVMLVLTSFHLGQFGRESGWGLDNWFAAFDNRQVVNALWNTITLSVTRQFIAFLVGVMIAWLIARTDLPCRNWIEVGFWIALFMPALPVAMAWILLLGGKSGVLNLWLAKLPFIDGPLINIYSWWGIVWVHLVTSTIPVKVFLLVPAFRNMDASLEESSRTCGASIIGTLFRIVIPIMMPTILVVMLLGLIRSMQAFEIELILGAPAQIEVYSTMIYRAINQEPPLHSVASVMSISFLALIIPFVIVQQWVSHRYSHATISGKFSARTQMLGAWRWPIFGVIVTMILIMTVLPTVMLLIGSFMKIFGNFSLPEPYTTRHWVAALSRNDVGRSLRNSLTLGGGAALFGMILYSMIAYITVKTKYGGRKIFDFITWLPTVLPGIVISLGFLQMFVGTMIFRPIYGTMWVLILAVVLAGLTVGVQIIKGSLIQINAELEEASWSSGASKLYTFVHIVLPLVAPTVAVIGLEVFATAISVVGIVALLGTGPNQPLSILQLVFMDSGRFESATIVGLFILVTTIIAALLARAVGTWASISRSD